MKVYVHIPLAVPVVTEMEYPLQPSRHDMDIRFISSLTADDENAFAPALLKAVSAVLDQFPIAYTLRVETTGAQVFQHTHPTFETSLPPSRAAVASLAHD